MKTQKKNKKTEDEIIDYTNRAINELVYDKVQLVKAYNYYHGKRDPEQFRHLEENYGIGTPTSIEFTPLVKKHIDVLIGEYLSSPVKPKVSCKDSTTLSNIFREKQLFIVDQIVKELNTHLKNTIYSTIYGGQSVEDISVKKKIEEIKQLAEQNFISNYEIAGQDLIDHILQAKNIDFANKRKLLLTDLCISGTCYYRVIPSPKRTNIDIEILNPLNTFIDRNPEDPYLNKSTRGVIRKYLTKHQILAKYGDILSEEDLKELDNLSDYSVDGSATTYLRSFDSVAAGTTSDGVLGGFEVTPLLPFERNNSKFFRVFPVYETEWLETEKEDGEFITNRYSSVRIGANIYIPRGKDEDVVRPMDDPNNIGLTINGMFFCSRNGDPYSLVLKTANLQDKYDIISFIRDNIIAQSGSVGSWIDIAHLPKVLGSKLSERLMKWDAYAKAGKKLYDSSQEGQMVNTSFNNFDDTLKMNTMQAFDIALDRIENICSNITGVFRERLNGIEQRDAVSNIQVGVKNSSFITKQYYQIMDLMTREILIDSLNTAKIVFKNGVSGTIILGENLNKIFTALPEHYSFTDYDIHIDDSSDLIAEMETIKQLSIEFTKSGQVSPEVIVEAITAKGLTKMKSNVINALTKQREENNQVNQYAQQVQQLDQQLKQSLQEVEKLRKQLESANTEKLKLERDKLSFEEKLGWFEAENSNNIEKERLEWEKKRVQLEGLQLLDTNKNNDEIKNQ